VLLRMREAWSVASAGASDPRGSVFGGSEGMRGREVDEGALDSLLSLKAGAGIANLSGLTGSGGVVMEEEEMDEVVKRSRDSLEVDAVLNARTEPLVVAGLVRRRDVRLKRLSLSGVMTNLVGWVSALSKLCVENVVLMRLLHLQPVDFSYLFEALAIGRRLEQVHVLDCGKEMQWDSLVPIIKVQMLRVLKISGSRLVNQPTPRFLRAFQSSNLVSLSMLCVGISDLGAQFIMENAPLTLRDLDLSFNVVELQQTKDFATRCHFQVSWRGNPVEGGIVKNNGPLKLKPRNGPPPRRRMLANLRQDFSCASTAGNLDGKDFQRLFHVWLDHETPSAPTSGRSAHSSISNTSTSTSGSLAAVEAFHFVLEDDEMTQPATKDFKILVTFPAHIPVYYLNSELRRPSWVLQCSRRPVEIGLFVQGDVRIAENVMQLENSYTVRVNSEGKVSEPVIWSNVEDSSFFSKRRGPATNIMINEENRIRLDLAIYKNNFSLIPGSTMFHVVVFLRFSNDEAPIQHSLAYLRLLSRGRGGKVDIPDEDINGFRENDRLCTNAMGFGRSRTHNQRWNPDNSFT